MHKVGYPPAPASRPIDCPRLIKRFVDPDAEFLFVPGDPVVAVTEPEHATPSPRPIAVVPNPERITALRDPAIQYALAGAEACDLAHSEGEPLRDDIRRRVEAPASELPSESARIG